MRKIFEIRTLKRNELCFKTLCLSVCALAVYVTTASTANAQFVFSQCNDCTETKREALAQSLGIGKHMVADFANNDLEGYTVSRESNGGSGHYIYELDPLEISTSQKEAFNNYYKLITVYHGNEIFVEVPQNRPSGYPTGTDQGSAVDWASNPAYYNEIDLYLTRLQTQSMPYAWVGASAMIALATLQSGYTVTNYKNSITYIITTPQGAIVKFEWGESGKAVLLSVVDQYGNFIPIRNYNGTTRFGGSYNVGDGGEPGYSGTLKGYLHSLGATISAQCVNGTLACIDGGGERTCEWVRCF